MTPDHRIEVDVGDGVSRPAFLDVLALRELQRLTAMGPQRLWLSFQLHRNPDGDPGFDHVRHIIRLGLIGGGLPPKDALALVDFYVTPQYGLKNAHLQAALIMDAVWHGFPERTEDADRAGKTAPPQGTTSI